MDRTKRQGVDGCLAASPVLSNGGASSHRANAFRRCLNKDGQGGCGARDDGGFADAAQSAEQVLDGDAARHQSVDHTVMAVFGPAGRSVRGWLRSVGPQRRFLGRDLLAGLPGAVSSVPDGMAAAILAGVNPVQGLYASFAGPIAGGLTARTRLMVITTTSAAALAAGSALGGVPAAQRPGPVRTFEATPLVGESTEAARLLRKRGWSEGRPDSWGHGWARWADSSRWDNARL